MDIAQRTDSDDKCFEISDDDYDEVDHLPDESDDIILEECERRAQRGSYERAWTTEATRALIHIRGPMEDKFNQGRHKRTTLWHYVTRQLHKLGYMYSAAKVQKKWHNILITYNKNICKKFQSGYVHWEFFEEMFKYLQGKKAQYDAPPNVNRLPTDNGHNQTFSNFIPLEVKPDMYIYDNSGSTHPKRMKFEPDQLDEMPLEITHENGNANVDNDWWKDYFDRRLKAEKEKIQCMKDIHHDTMSFNKMSLLQQESMERVKIEAINNLTTTIQKLIDVKSSSC